MSQEKSSGQFKILSTGADILPPPLQASIDEIAKNVGYITYTIFSRSISTNGGNYLGELFEVDIKGKTADGEKKTNLFIKNRIEDSTLDFLNTKECYKVENFFYGELSKIYDEMQKKANIPVNERYIVVKSYDSTNANAVILENLDKKGFTTVHRMDVPPLKFMELTIQQLARFHGLSWALEKQLPEYFARKIQTMATNFYFNDYYQGFIDNISKFTERNLDKEMKLKLAKLRPHMLDILRRSYIENDGVKCCLCHGDFRANNILVKKDGDDDAITEVIPVDYQLLHYGCPVMDFHYFIILCTDSEFRRKHLDYLKDLYHDSLAKFLNYFDMDVDSVYPRHEFEDQYKKRLNFGLITGLLTLPVLFTNDDVVPDINKTDMSSITVSPDRKMDERVKGILDDFQNYGVL